MYNNLKLDHLHYRASDFTETRNFYLNILGASELPMVQLGADFHLRFEIAGTILLFAPDQRTTKTPAVPAGERLGAYHFALLVDDCENATAYYKSRGAVFSMENKEISGLKVSFLEAPDGMTVELKEVVGK